MHQRNKKRIHTADTVGKTRGDNVTCQTSAAVYTVAHTTKLECKAHSIFAMINTMTSMHSEWFYEKPCLSYVDVLHEFFSALHAKQATIPPKVNLYVGAAVARLHIYILLHLPATKHASVSTKYHQCNIKSTASEHEYKPVEVNLLGTPCWNRAAPKYAMLFADNCSNQTLQ